MKSNLFLAANRIKRMKCFFVLTVSLIVCVAISGCTVNRVSALTREQTGTPVKASEVRFFPTFKDISAPWMIEGMISAYTMPIMSNSAEKREALIRNTVADMGVNTVVGLQSLTGVGTSNGILANVGTNSQKNAQPMPKFIVFLPAVNFMIEKDASMSNLDDELRERIQYLMSYTKGYYVYRYDVPGVSNASVLQSGIDPAALVEPLGIMPDFALLCDVVGYDESGNIMTSSAKTLKINMTLFDLKEKKVFWTSTGSGMSTQSFLMGSIPLGPLFSMSQLLTNSEERSLIVRKAISDAIDSLPKVHGFQGGSTAHGFRGDSIAPVDRK